MRTVWPRLTTGLAAGLAAGLLLSGCGGDSPEPKPLPKDSKSSPSASPSATPPAMPAAAKKKTKAGPMRSSSTTFGSSTTRARVVRRPDSAALSLDTCVECEAIADGIDKVYADGGSHRRRRLDVARRFKLHDIDRQRRTSLTRSVDYERPTCDQEQGRVTRALPREHGIVCRAFVAGTCGEQMESVRTGSDGMIRPAAFLVLVSCSLPLRLFARDDPTGRARRQTRFDAILSESKRGAAVKDRHDWRRRWY